MAIRNDDATVFDGVKGYGVNSTTGYLEPVVDVGTGLGTDGPPATAKRFILALLEKLSIQGDGGAKLEIKSIEEDITLATGGTTTDSTANLLPANSVILAVCGEVLTTITANATGWSLCDATTAARFLANTTDLAAGTFKVGFLQWAGTADTVAKGPTQPSADKVRITAAGGNPGAGKIRVTVFYLAGSKAA